MNYLRGLQERDDEMREVLRALGGLLLGVGALVLAIRRGSFDDGWGELALFVVFALPAVLLYGGGFLAARDAVSPRQWHGVFIVFGLVFLLFALLQFVDLVGGDTGAPLNAAWIFGAIAAAGIAAALLAGVSFGWLAAGIAAIVVWLSLSSEILGDDFDDAGTFRGLCVLIAGGLVLAGLLLHRRLGGPVHEPAAHEPPPHARVRAHATPLELVTAGGLAFLLGTGLVSATGAVAAGISSAIAPLGGAPASGGIGEPSLFWDAVLLVGSLALVAFGSHLGRRGPAYVGALGLTLFVVIVGLDLDDSSPTGTIMGWPLILLALGAAALIASAVVPGERRDPQAPPSG